MKSRACGSTRFMKTPNCVRAVVALVVSLGSSGALAQVPPAPAPATPAWPADAAGLTALGTELANQWVTARSAGVPEATGALMQPGFQLVTFRGAADKVSGSSRLVGVKTSESRVTNVVATRTGDALVVTYLVTGSITVEGKAMPDAPMPRLAVWQPTDAGWRLAALASLVMPKERPETTPPAFAGDAALNAEGQAMLTKFLGAQQRKDMKSFELMLADGLQAVNFKGQKVRADLIQGAQHATTQPPQINDARATRSGDLTIVSCNLGMEQKIGFTTLPGTPVPFLAVFQGTGDDAKVIAIANTNRPK